MEINELIEMRKQILILKEKLNEQEIINDSMIKEYMHGKVDVIRRKIIISNFCAVFSIIVFFFQYAAGLFSFPFMLTTALLMIACIIANWYIHRNILDASIFTNNIIFTTQEFVKVKTLNHRWFIYSTPLLLPWIAWVAYEELLNVIGYFDMKIYSIILLFFSLFALLGFLLGYRMYKKVMKSCDDIIAQLDRIKE
ncbi:MAG: hypothetical protein KBT33_11775 [Prevotellaceae bacterium]|nr:hypothetical protein [Candidatus Minthosoma equi]